MSKRKEQEVLDKDERIKKHVRSHPSENEKGQSRLNRIEPKHKPMKKKKINLLDTYEKYGDDFEGYEE